MDWSIIKNQIKFWETVLKDTEGERKLLDTRIATIKTTIKSLRAMLPKEEKPDPTLSEGRPEDNL